MRIVSLLPSATEIVYALGLGDDLVGVTHECDFPPEAAGVRVVSHSALPPAATPAEIDRMVSTSVGDGDPIYRLDAEAIRDLQPDLVVSQDLCAVCAVPSGHVNDALDVLGCRADVLSLDPSSLGDVLTCIAWIGDATGTRARADEVVAQLHERLDAVAAAVAGRNRPRTFALEWSDPPFNGGHWVGEMIENAGGEPVLAQSGSPSIRVRWEDIEAAGPEIVVFMPCGYDAPMAAAETASFVHHPALASATSIYAVDANAFFSRPGPRLVDGVEILAALLHPDAVPAPPPGSAIRVR